LTYCISANAKKENKEKYIAKTNRYECEIEFKLGKFDFDENFRLPKDPLTELQKKVMNGTTTPQLLPENPERYWVRFGIGGTTYDAFLKGVLPIDEIY
jgi:hypothetical protein